MRKEKILVVDNDLISMDLLFNILKDKYEILSATDMDSALHIVENNRPNLILLDIILPNFDGYEIAKVLKSNSMTSEIPIIFITELTEAQYISKSYEYG
jgi:two-component system sensor histidine kinase/response regulator